MGNTHAGSGWDSPGSLRDGKRKTGGRGARVREEDREDATLGDRPRVEASQKGSVIEATDRKYIPASEVIAEWHKDPDYVAAYEASADDWALAEAVIRARGRRTQEELAGLMGTTQAAIARLESGWYKPSVRTLEKLAAVTGKRLMIRFAPLQRKRRKTKSLTPVS